MAVRRGRGKRNRQRKNGRRGTHTWKVYAGLAGYPGTRDRGDGDGGKVWGPGEDVDRVSRLGARSGGPPGEVLFAGGTGLMPPSLCVLQRRGPASDM